MMTEEQNKEWKERNRIAKLIGKKMTLIRGDDTKMRPDMYVPSWGTFGPVTPRQKPKLSKKERKAIKRRKHRLLHRKALND